MSNVPQTFQDILNGKGLMPSEIITDGNLHRCPTQTKPHKQNGAYIAHLNAPATLRWCNWEDGEQGSFTDTEKKIHSPAEKEVLKKRHSAMKLQREAEFAQRQSAAALRAQSEYAASSTCSPDHPYLHSKGVPPLGDIRQMQNGAILVPIRDISGNLQSLQRIFPNGEKRFLTGGKVSGGYYSIQESRKSLSPFAKAMPLEQVSTLLVNAQFMWLFPPTIFPS